MDAANDVFRDLSVIGAWRPEHVAAKLRELGEVELTEAVEDGQVDGGTPATFGTGERWWPFGRGPEPAWVHTSHVYGYLAPGVPGDDPLPLRHAGSIAADQSLKNERVTVTLDQLRVAQYPGGGTHRVLLDFAAENWVKGGGERLHFNATYRAREGERAGVSGYPIFVGLTVGPGGICFNCATVNVKNDGDEVFLAALESDTFKAGLRLASTAQPAIGPLAELALGLTKGIAARNRNVAVQNFCLGLDFSDVVTRARLAVGSYLAVQVPESLTRVWDWAEWVYHPTSGQVVSKADATRLIPYNYILFSVSRYAG